VTYVRQENWPRALEAAEAAIRLEPFHAESRSTLIAILLATGEYVRARKEFETLGTIDPAYQERIRAWFEARIGR
jgi:protein involved in temperature-dependent protein secretion